MNNRIDIHINMSEVIGEAVADILEKQGLAMIPRDTGEAALAAAAAKPGSTEEATALAELRVLVERDRANAPKG